MLLFTVYCDMGHSLAYASRVQSVTEAEFSNEEHTIQSEICTSNLHTQQLALRNQQLKIHLQTFLVTLTEGGRD